MPVILTSTAYEIYLLCAKLFWVLDTNLIKMVQGFDGVSGANWVNSYLKAYTSFPLTVMSVLAIVSAAINCYHCKTFKEELH